MSGYWEPPSDYRTPEYIGNGSTHGNGGEPEPGDRAEQVRKVAEEVCGRPMVRPPKRRMGFLP